MFQIEEKPSLLKKRKYQQGFQFMKSLFTKFGQPTVSSYKHINYSKSRAFEVFREKTFVFYSIFSLKNNHKACKFEDMINKNQKMEYLCVSWNSVYSFFKSVKFLCLLFFFSFSSVAWSPSESDCNDDYYGLEKGAGNKCNQDEGNKCEPTLNHAQHCSPRYNDNGNIITCDRSDSQVYIRRKERCSQWREDQQKERDAKQREEDKAIESAEQELDRTNEQLREQRERAERQRQEQKALMEASKQECKTQHDMFRGERNNIENQVRDIEKQIDEKRQAIINENIATSRDEEELKQSIQKLKEQHRKLLNEWEGNLSKQSDDFDMRFETIKLQLFEAQNQLEQAEIAKQTACTDRFNAYDLTDRQCYDQAMAEVSATRQTYYTRLYQGNQDFSSASEVFSTGFEDVEQRFTNLLNEKKRLCYQNAIGNTEIVACNLETIQARDKSCQKAKQDSRCPTPQAVVIENKLRNVLAGVALEQKKAKEAMENIYKQIGELPAKKKEAIQQLQKQLKNAKQSFEEEFARLSRKLEERQLLRFQRIRKFTEEIQRLEEIDPARHFKEELDFALHACCSQGPTRPGDPYLCRKIREYASTANTRQFLFISSTPRSGSPAGGGGGGSR